MRKWADKEQLKCWQTMDGCCQAKVFLHGPYIYTFCSEVKKARVVDVTGPAYWPFYKHLTAVHIDNNPLCPACREGEETFLHFLLCHYDDTLLHTPYSLKSFIR